MIKMARYMRADKMDLMRVYRDLKREKWTLKKISNFIGSDFRNALYKGRGLKESSFLKNM